MIDQRLYYGLDLKDSMEFQCLTHGSVDKFKLSGYAVAHESPVKAHEKDFEGITFVVHKTDGDEITADNIESEGASSYLEKFADWDSDIAEAVQNYYQTGRGAEEFACPHRNDTDRMCVTHIVDQVFIPDVDGELMGSYRVIDGVLHIHDVQEMGGLEPRTFFNKLINQARNDDIKSIKISTYNSDLKETLEDVGFETRIEGRHNELIGEKNL